MESRRHVLVPRRAVPLVTVALLGGAIVAFLMGEATASPLLFRAGDFSAGRWWTAWTAHGVHFSGSHLLWDALAVGALGGWLERRAGRFPFCMLIFLAAPFVTLGTMCLEGNLSGYGGFSGLACVLAGAIVVRGWQSGGNARTVALLLGGGLAVKIVWELWHPGAALFVEAGSAAMRPVASAHAVGVLAGGALWWALASLSTFRGSVDGSDSVASRAGRVVGRGYRM